VQAYIPAGVDAILLRHA